MATRNSRLGGFYQLNLFERLQAVRSFDGLSDEDLRQLHGGTGALSVERADKMIENVIGTFNLPLGIATNFQIKGRDVLIPMVIEVPSFVAGASYAAKLVREGGGFQTSSTAPIMIGQIQLVHISDPCRARFDILARKAERSWRWRTGRAPAS
jgi:hydroxymethylglutaryl-CoA reductase